MIAGTAYQPSIAPISPDSIRCTLLGGTGMWISEAAKNAAVIIDARGKVVAPGFVAVDSGLGGSEISSVGGSDDLHALGLIVWMDVPVPTAFERMAREGLPPFLADKPDPSVEFNRICAVRRPVFRAAADAVLELPEVLPVEEAIDRLLIVLESKVISQ